MPCYKPIDAWRTPTGQIIFYDSPGVKYQPIPCGMCIGCRLDRSREWALRCMHESTLHKENCFITLTYDEKNLPHDTSLNPPDVQKFFKRLRKRLKGKKIRYYYCGEYGDKNGRPHYHILLFGHDFTDRIFSGKTQSGLPLYTSPTLESVWGNGIVQVGDITFESAAYVARYIMKKVVGKGKDKVDEKTGLKPYERYQCDELTGEVTRVVEVLPEYTAMSRGGRGSDGVQLGGIGSGWYDKYKGDLYPKDFITHNGSRHKPPRFYDEKLKKENPDLYDELKAWRAKNGYDSDDNKPGRLKSREKVAQAKTTQLKRSL
jgi:hypothetical protein